MQPEDLRCDVWRISRQYHPSMMEEVLLLRSRMLERSSMHVSCKFFMTLHDTESQSRVSRKEG